jgi:SAM-dependent methyltransferase
MPKKYTLARKGADRNLLYEWAVQDADFEVELAVEQYEKRRNRSPMILREDFCGTALVASRWVQSHPARQAIGLDLDAATLGWAREHNVAPLGADADRVQLWESDVRTVTEPKADIVQAFNFSYFLFHERSDLVDYFDKVRRSLAPGGIFMLDCYGGWQYQRAKKDRRTVKSPAGNFGFVWEHADFNPIDNRTRCHIHFEFQKGKRWKKAFSYDFRLYSLAEIRDALTAAAYRNIEVLWDFEDDEDASSDFRPASRAENCPGWIAYILADAENGSGHPAE